MIDPQQRWASIGEKPDYAGPLSYAGMPLTQDPVDLDGVDVAIVGAPTDDLVSDRPGTRFAPRAIRAASCPPGPQPRNQGRRDGRAAGRGLRRRARPAGGPRPLPRRDTGDGRRRCSPPAPDPDGYRRGPLDLRAERARLRRRARALGLVHFDTHTDTGAEVFGVELSHGTIMRRLVEDGHVDPLRYAQIGLRGYWPGDEEFSWQAEHGITSLFMHDDPGSRDKGGDPPCDWRPSDRARVS